jgi:iron(III) transport system substrate-binding protein
MTRIRALLRLMNVVAAFAAVLLMASAATAADLKWEDVVKAAEVEGVVNVHGGPGRSFTTALSDGFAKAFPKIQINYDGAPGREGIPKIVRERQSGIFNWDVYVGGPTSLLPALKPIGGLTPLKAELILPEVLDDKAWRGGFDAGWMDLDKKYMFAFDLTEESTVVVNWDFVKKEDLKTALDMMKPQFMGKIVSLDPRALGDSIFSFQTFHLNFGEPFVIDLLSKQKLVYTTNRRQAAEWLVRGVYPIGIATPMDDIRIFQEQGLGKNIETFRVGANTPVAGSGFGNVAILERAPHPNAARVYVNWLLSKAGQTGWKVMARNTRRLDVPLATPEFAPPADAVTVNLQAENYHEMREYIVALAKKHIPVEAAK